MLIRGWFAGCALIVSVSAAAAVPQSQHDALVAFYNSTSGPTWTDNNGWLGAGTECKWFGVTCDDDQANITGLGLAQNNLRGTIPAAIGDLPALRALHLWENSLTGPIPGDIGRLAALEDLILDHNPLSGSLPPALGSFTKLQRLRINGTNIAGTIPRELGNLSSLQELRLNYNQLSGEIPHELGQLSKLTILDLESNKLGGAIPKELGFLVSLQELDLNSNQLSGSIPPELGQLTNLARLSLYANQLSGTIPSLGALRNLEVLYLGNNQFGGVVPDDTGSLAALRVLDLSQNKFSGAFPPAVLRLTNLQRVQLDHNEFRGEIPHGIGALTNLQALSLGSNAFTGSIPTEIGNLTALESIDFASNQLTGAIPTTVGKLTNLTGFSVYSNQLSGVIPSEIGNLTKLNILFLFDNRMSGPIPDSFRNLRNLVQLTLGGNPVGGSIPVWIGELTNLTRLQISDAELSGSIPPGITQLSKLDTLQLDNNELTGQIPSDIGSLHELTWLSLPNNDLDGTLPADIGNLTNLQYLSLWGNRFSGTIPKEIGRLVNLLHLDISGNAFRGPVPAEIKSLTLLTNGQSGFNSNALYTADTSVRDFLNTKEGGDFTLTQTVTPANPRVTTTTDRGATVEWDLIPYTDNGGGYQVAASTSAGGTPTTIATTGSKEVNSILVRGLSASTTYFFTVSAVTHPHDYQRNVVVSDPTAAISATTGPRVVAPADVVVTEPAGGLVQVDGVPQNVDTFTLTNYGDATTAITITKGDGDYFTFQPATFSLAGGASQIVTVQSLTKPVGSYYNGYVVVTGDGTGDGIGIPIVLLSSTRPSGTVTAVAVDTRIELAGAPGSDSIGTAKFRNAGTATLSGIVISDQPWVQPATDPISIDPGATTTVTFKVVRAKRPPGIGALTANLSLVYVAGSAGSTALAIGFDAPSSGISVTKVTVVDVTKPTVTPNSIPGTLPGEVALFAPGVATFQRALDRYASAISIVNSSAARSLNDLRLYFTPAGSSSTSLASLPVIGSTQSVSLVNVVTNVYGVSDGAGTLQIRSSDWRSIAAVAKLSSSKSSGSLLGDVPIFRSDRSAGANQATYLTGLRTGADLYLQETSGGAATARIDFLDASGAASGQSRTETLAAFALDELRGIVPVNAITAIITNNAASTGRIAAYARVIDDRSGDVWSVVDWSRVNKYALTEAMRIPFAEGTTASGGGRRRAAPHAVQVISPSTEVTLFNPTTDDARAKMQVINAGGAIVERDVVVSARRTITLTDAASPVPLAHIVLVPIRGQLIVTAHDYRTADKSIGSAVPVVSATSGLRVGQSQIFADLDDSTSSTIAASTPNTFRTSYGFVESSGAKVTVRASVVISDPKSIASAVLARDFTLAPRQQLVLAELVRSIVGTSRDSAYSDLHGLQLRIDVMSGNGSVVPFVIITDNGSGDSVVRLE